MATAPPKGGGAISSAAGPASLAAPEQLQVYVSRVPKSVSPHIKDLILSQSGVRSLRRAVGPQRIHGLSDGRRRVWNREGCPALASETRRLKEH